MLSLPLQVLTGVASGLRVDEVQDTVTKKEPKEVDRRALTHAWNHSWGHTKRGLQYNGQCIIITVTMLNKYNSLAIEYGREVKAWLLLEVALAEWVGWSLLAPVESRYRDIVMAWHG